EEEIWLLGQPSVQEYLDFVKDTVVGPFPRPMALVDEWRRANDYYAELEHSETGIADTVGCAALDPAMTALAEKATADPSFRRVFDTLPTTFAMVELDKLMVAQKSVNGTYFEKLAARMGPDAAPEDVFRFCVPLEAPEIAVHTQKVGSKRWSFRCDSIDFRFHEAAFLRPDQVSG